MQAALGIAIGAIGGFVVYRTPTPKSDDATIAPSVAPMPRPFAATGVALQSAERTAPPAEPMRRAAPVETRVAAASVPAASPPAPEAAPPTPEELGGSVRIVPALPHGPQGLRAYPVGDRRAFLQLGLHSGDLITAINGMPVTSENTESVRALLTSGQIKSVTVSRAEGDYQLDTAPSK